jgi:hypothetical protein
MSVLFDVWIHQCITTIWYEYEKKRDVSEQNLSSGMVFVTHMNVCSL